MKVLVTGSRFYTDYQQVLQCLQKLNVSLVIAGGCRGADTLAIQAVKACGYPFIEYPADWKRYGRSAGPRRNQHMINMEKPDLVVAFHEAFASSKGTQDMVSRAIKAGIPYILVT